MNPDDPTTAAKAILDGQRGQWDTTFAHKPEMFGAQPSDPAREAAEVFIRESKTTLLELGGGQGRDTLYFARRGLNVTVLDYSPQALEAIAAKADASGLGARTTPMQHDVREPLPFADASFDCCFSHMLFCMALTTPELERLSREVCRVLVPRGLCVYTVRHTGDAHWRAGIHRGEEMYEVGGFIVHFFTAEKVRDLANGYEVVGIDEFEEGGLPRKLFRVTLRKEGST